MTLADFLHCFRAWREANGQADDVLSEREFDALLDLNPVKMSLV